MAAGIVAISFSLLACDGESRRGELSSKASLSRERTVVAELNQFWTAKSGLLGFKYRLVRADRVTDGTNGTRCNGRTVRATRRALRGNAYVDGDCREGVLVAYDPTWIRKRPGRMEAVLAHEWGHVIQLQHAKVDARGKAGLDIDSELQASCFAGAFLAEYLGPNHLETPRAALLALADRRTVRIRARNAHGRRNEIRRLFDHGAENGVKACTGRDLRRLLPR